MIAADAWNKAVALAKRARPLRGLRCETKELANGVIVSGDASALWRHPWHINARYEFKDDGTGEWRAFVRPGFVNGRDAHFSMPADWPDGKPLEDEAAADRDVPLTNDPAPYLILGGWRNPLMPDSVSASLSGQIIAVAAEGYPKFFEKLGVKPAAKGGDVTKPGALEGEPDETRTREIRAMDVVLSKARIGTRLQIDLHDPLLEAQTESISTVFLNDYLRSTGGRAKLRAAAKYRPPEEQSLALMYGTLLNAGDAQFDELKMATVWIVSPPDVGEDTEPDETWTPYPQHFVFWNLQHASRLVIPKAPPAPLGLDLPLAGGVAQPIINGLLSFINDRNAEAWAFFNQADARGLFWST
ncbi:MAG: hypothetical protein QOE70_5487 [Chthoniobacter sp.]|jgi:hypothetical protein|nr:hypothetical protein [Chthoniobacter sp.]